ncbi:flagellar biosynthesis anti-sigma factor FlgM [Coralloluteibacterium thermophilus]|uniref:Negative regulator of flagellin synthesis n=1 Tax=Coralloluteibacterium thermophilum TaxID=2707049 RepID=A0ABV9NQI5_9GAMM
MSNKIEGAGMPNIYRLASVAGPGVERAGANRDAPVAARPDADSVRLSSEGSSLQSLQRQDVGAPFDGTRVAALRASIDDGSYTVNPRRIADAMLAFEGRT